MHHIGAVAFDEFVSQSVATREIEVWIEDRRGWEEDPSEILVEFYDIYKNKLSEARTLISTLDNRPKLQIPSDDSVAYIKIQKQKR